jgi:hypothetical protein
MYITQHDISHKVMLVKLTYTYRPGTTDFNLYEAVRGVWRASYDRASSVDYVFGIHGQTIVAVYKPTKWHYVRDRVDVPRPHEIRGAEFERVKNRLYFVCNDYEEKDEWQEHYLGQVITDLQIGQNPVSYINA